MRYIQYIDDGLKTGAYKMDENKVTVSESGENSQINYDLIAEKVLQTLNAAENKKAKVEHSIVEDNAKQFTEEEAKIFREMIEEKKNKAREEAEKKAHEKDDLIAKLQEENNAFKTKEKKNLLDNSLSSIYEELGITEEGSQKQAHRLAFSGVDVNTFFKEDGTVDNDKVKKAFEDVLVDVPSLASAKKKVEIKETPHDDTDEAVEKRKNARLKKWRLDDEEDKKELTSTPSGFKSKLLQ